MRCPLHRTKESTAPRNEGAALRREERPDGRQPVQGGVEKIKIESSVGIQGRAIHPRELQRRKQCLWIVQGA